MKPNPPNQPPNQPPNPSPISESKCRGSAISSVISRFQSIFGVHDFFDKSKAEDFDRTTITCRPTWPDDSPCPCEHYVTVRFEIDAAI